MGAHEEVKSLMRQLGLSVGKGAARTAALLDASEATVLSWTRPQTSRAARPIPEDRLLLLRAWASGLIQMPEQIGGSDLLGSMLDYGFVCRMGAFQAHVFGGAPSDPPPGGFCPATAVRVVEALVGPGVRIGTAAPAIVAVAERIAGADDDVFGRLLARLRPEHPMLLQWEGIGRDHGRAYLAVVVQAEDGVRIELAVDAWGQRPDASIDGLRLVGQRGSVAATWVVRSDTGAVERIERDATGAARNLRPDERADWSARLAAALVALECAGLASLTHETRQADNLPPRDEWDRMRSENADDTAWAFGSAVTPPRTP